MSNATDSKTIAVIGGAGAMGRITVRDLVETAPDNVRIVIADYNEGAAKKQAKAYRRKVEAVRCDVNDVKKTAKLLDGVFAVINCTQHQFNLKVMNAALQAGAHYCDLGGLFHVTRQQLELDDKFKTKELTAILGIGAAPGVVNVLARSAADTMDQVREIHCIVANVDRTPDRPSGALATSYSIQTILEEASLPAAVYSDGKFGFVDPMSGAEDIAFPEPVGIKRPARTIHSEVATLPLSYADKGVREVSFRIAFPKELDEQLRFLREIGLLSEKPIAFGKSKIVPRDFLLKVLAGIERPSYDGIPDEYEIVRALVRGVRGNKVVEEIVDCHVPGVPSWGFGIDVDTGCPPSIAMQMLARGEITLRGCVPPERAIPAQPFFAELLKRGMTVRRRELVLGVVPARAKAEAKNGAPNGKAENGKSTRSSAKPKKKRAAVPSQARARPRARA
jgi:saccharopine dehydrogenase-like NADP-dependent oxidoreductase